MTPAASDAQVKRLGTVAVELERNLLQVEDDVGRIFDHAGDRLELVQHALDADGGNSGALDRGEQGAAQGVADRGTEAALKRLRGELAVLVGEGFGVDGETLGLLETSPKHVYLLSSSPAAMHSAVWSGGAVAGCEL